MTNSCFLMHATLRVHQTPGIPAPSAFSRVIPGKTLGQIVSREGRAVSFEALKSAVYRLRWRRGRCAIHISFCASLDRLMKATDSIVTSYVRLKNERALLTLKEQRLRLLAQSDAKSPFFTRFRGQCLEEIAAIEAGLAAFRPPEALVSRPVLPTVEFHRFPVQAAAPPAVAGDAMPAVSGVIHDFRASNAAEKAIPPRQVQENPPPRPSAIVKVKEELPPFLPDAMRAFPPDIYIDFQADKAWKRSGNQVAAATSLVGVSRGSEAWQLDGSGNWWRFPQDELAVTDLGASIWNGGTNLHNNSSLQGAMIGEPGTDPTNTHSTASIGGLARRIVAVGVDPTGVETIAFRYAGTATGKSGPNILIPNQVTASSGQTWCLSAWLALVIHRGATPVVRLEIDERNGPAFLAGTQARIEPTAKLMRYQTSRLNNQSSTTGELGYINIGIAEGQEYDFTITAGWPQLEQGDAAVASPPIRTMGDPAVRSAEVTSIDMAGLPPFGSSYSIYARGTPKPEPHIRFCSRLSSFALMARTQFRCEGTPRPARHSPHLSVMPPWRERIATRSFRPARPLGAGVSRAEWPRPSLQAVRPWPSTGPWEAPAMRCCRRHQPAPSWVRETTAPTSGGTATSRKSPSGSTSVSPTNSCRALPDRSTRSRPADHLRRAA